MNSFLEISVFIFLTGLMGSGVFLTFQTRKYQMLFLFGGLFLVCLIFTMPKVESLLIDDNMLLQMNGAIIAGAFILMSISGLPMVIKVFKQGVLFTPMQIGCGVVGAFSVSSIFLLLGSLDASKAIDFMGFIWMIVSCMVVAVKDPMLKGGEPAQ